MTSSTGFNIFGWIMPVGIEMELVMVYIEHLLPGSPACSKAGLLKGDGLLRVLYSPMDG